VERKSVLDELLVDDEAVLVHHGLQRVADAAFLLHVVANLLDRHGVAVLDARGLEELGEHPVAEVLSITTYFTRCSFATSTSVFRLSSA
jgi:hypothetical protein